MFDMNVFKTVSYFLRNSLSRVGVSSYIPVPYVIVQHANNKVSTIKPFIIHL